MPREAAKVPGLRKRGPLYYCTLSVDGKQREESCRTGDLREAKAYRARRLREIAAGDVPGGLGSLTIAAYAKRWLPTRGRSADYEERWLRLHIEPDIGDRVLETLRPKDVAAWVESLKARGLSARSIRNAHGVLSVMLEHARFEEAIVSNVAKGLPRGTLPKIGRSTEPAFATEQVGILLFDERIEHVRRVLYALAAFGGMRAGEAAGRRWRDLQAREPLDALHVATQYDARPLKGADGEDDAARVVPVHPELAEILATWRGAWSTYYGREPRPEDWITPFDHHAAGPMTRDQITKAMARDLVKVGIDATPGLGMHSCRRWFITTARGAGADAATVAEITHRPRGDVLEASYTRRSWETLCRVVEALGDSEPTPRAWGDSWGGLENPVENGGGAGNRTLVRERSRPASTCVFRDLYFASFAPTDGLSRR